MDVQDSAVAEPIFWPSHEGGRDRTVVVVAQIDRVCPESLQQRVGLPLDRSGLPHGDGRGRHRSLTSRTSPIGPIRLLTAMRHVSTSRVLPMRLGALDGATLWAPLRRDTISAVEERHSANGRIRNNPRSSFRAAPKPSSALYRIAISPISAHPSAGMRSHHATYVASAQG